MFDFRFTRFFTNGLISFLWILSVFSASLVVIGCVIVCALMVQNGIPIKEYFIITPIATVIGLFFTRIGFELVIVLFRIETHLRAIRDHYDKK